MADNNWKENLIPLTSVEDQLRRVNDCVNECLGLIISGKREKAVAIEDQKKCLNSLQFAMENLEKVKNILEIAKVFSFNVEDWIDKDEEAEKMKRMKVVDAFFTGTLKQEQLSQKYSEDDFDDLDEEDLLQACEDAERSCHEKQIEATQASEVNAGSRPSSKHLTVLHKSFGHQNFRPMQWRIIRNILEDKQDQCVIMSTGYGKSLCYQYPAVFSGKTTVVVSPLIALMEDQVLALKVANIPAVYLKSAQSISAEVRKELMNGKIRLVYMSPECIENGREFLQSLNEKAGICLIAIDEAHCVSMWGHDFRGAYRKLGHLRQLLPKVPFVAVTATATPRVKSDIIHSLHLQNPITTCTGFDRCNLYLSVSKKSSSIHDDLMRFLKKNGDKFQFDGPTIVYCPTKKATMGVAGVLKAMGVNCAAYHAGLPQEARTNAHYKFVNDRVQVVVATIAFGMGIDKPDVRNVIHYGAPQDIETYYQEIGRAGRDGLPSKCYVVYSAGDFTINRFHLRTITSEKFRDHKTNMIRLMEEYLNALSCRRRNLLKYFEGDSAKVTAKENKCCDNCTRRLAGGDAINKKANFAKEAFDLMEAILETGSCYGLTVPILFIRGSKSQRLPNVHYNHPKFGCGKRLPDVWWKALGRRLIAEGYLAQKEIVACDKKFVSLMIVSVSPKGSNWLNEYEMEKRELLLEPTQELQRPEKRAVKATFVVSNPEWCTRIDDAVPTTSGAREEIVEFKEEELKLKVSVQKEEEVLLSELFAKLIGERDKIAHELDVRPYMITNNKTLLEISKIRPNTMARLKEVDGMSDVKVTKFGNRFIAIIKDFCQNKNLSTAENAAENSSAEKPSEDTGANVQESYVGQNIQYKEVIKQELLNKIATENKDDVSTAPATFLGDVQKKQSDEENLLDIKQKRSLANWATSSQEQRPLRKKPKILKL